MYEWYDRITVFALFILMINTILYSYLNKDRDYPIHAFKLYLIFALIMQLIGRALYIQKFNNLPGLHLYTLIEFFILSFFYKVIIQFNEVKNVRFNLFILTIGGLVIANSIFLQSIYTFNSNAKTLTQLIIMSYAIAYYFLQLNNRIETNRILNILNAAILIYYAGSFFIFMFSNVLLSNLDQDTQAIFWLFNAILYLVFQLLVLFAGWQHFFKTKSSR